MILQYGGNKCFVECFSGQMGQSLLLLFMLCVELNRKIDPFTGRQFFDFLTRILVVFTNLRPKFPHVFTRSLLECKRTECNFSQLALGSLLQERHFLVIQLLSGFERSGGEKYGDDDYCDE